MLRIKDQEFSGTVGVSGDDELTVVIATSSMFEDVLAMTKDVKEIYATAKDGTETVYNVTRPISASLVSRNVYAIRFSTKKSETQLLEEKNQELSDAIDEILVMMLEE